jgi:hypothetical protein
MYEISSDRRITYWLKNRELQNFGDSLSELLYWALCQRDADGKIISRASGPYDAIYLIGSVISADRINQALEHCRAGNPRPLAFWGCGARGRDVIPGELTRHCDFRAVRGPLTMEVLGLPTTTPLGDPGLLLPLLYQPQIVPKFAGKAICVPHCLDRKSDAEILRETGVDYVVRPVVRPEPADILHLIDIIHSVGFVLSGAMHFCILAFAYGTAFSYWSAGHLDTPFKWEDFSASIGISCRFAKTLDEGLRIHANVIAGKGKMPPLAPLIASAPLIPPDELLRMAIAFDQQHQKLPALHAL